MIDPSSPRLAQRGSWPMRLHRAQRVSDLGGCIERRYSPNPLPPGAQIALLCRKMVTIGGKR